MNLLSIIRLSRTALAALLLALPWPGVAGAQSVVTIFSNTTIGAGDATYDGQIVRVVGATVTVEGPHTFASLELSGGAVVTHPPGAPEGLDLATAGDLVVEAGSRIFVDGRGHGAGSGPGGGAGSTYTGGGAGHGGTGGAGVGG
ncbi:MAG: hypothetical protein AB1578_22220, partial [Thermodesulfobacteriota bacterium]